MRRVHRPALSEAAQNKLCELTIEVAIAGHRAERIGERAEDRKKAARSLWDNRTTNKAFVEIRTVLRDMAPGTGFCMYCEVGLGNTIDHFWPKEKYPGRAFTWENYLWSCSACNSDFKGTKLPRDAQGRPLLVNPSEEDPGEHLDFSPTTGKITGATPKGKATVETLGFERRGKLDQARSNAWNGLQELLIRYSAHCAVPDAARALRVQRTICQHPFAAALATMLRWADDPRHRQVLHPECLAAIEGHPEIRTWP